MTRPEVLVLSGMPSETPETVDDLTAPIREAHPDVGLAIATDYADSLDRIATADAVIAQHPTAEQLDAAEELEWLHALAAGVDYLPLDRLADDGVAVTTASSANANAVAEHALSLLLAFERGLPETIRNEERAEWRLLSAGELRGQTVGLLGVGEIGTRVAELCDALGMHVVGLKRDPTEAPDVLDAVYGQDGLHTVLGQSDYVVVACPLTDETRGMLTIKEFSTSMKRSAVLVNVARGEVVNQDHLAVAVQRGFIGGAALDVFEDEPLPPESPLWQCEDVLVTPHVAGATDRFLAGCGELFAENYEHFVAGRLDDLRNRVV